MVELFEKPNKASAVPDMRDVALDRASQCFHMTFCHRLYTLQTSAHQNQPSTTVFPLPKGDSCIYSKLRCFTNIFPKIVIAFKYIYIYTQSLSLGSPVSPSSAANRKQHLKSKALCSLDQEQLFHRRLMFQGCRFPRLSLAPYAIFNMVFPPFSLVELDYFKYLIATCPEVL